MWAFLLLARKRSDYTSQQYQTLRFKMIYVDADACPVQIREILYRAADRAAIDTVFVANHYIKHPPSVHIKTLQVEKGFDVADNEIVKRIEAGQLVITSDIPLASESIDKGASAITPSGEALTAANVKSRLNIRDFMDTMRASVVQTGGPKAMSQKEKQDFANALDRWIASRKK